MTEQNFLYRTERIGVRALARPDLQGPYPGWFSDLEVCKYNSHGVFMMSMKELEAYIDSLAGSRSQIVWAVVDLATGTHVGNVSLQGINTVYRSAEFAILLGEKAFWGKGYGQEAGRLLLRHGFERLNLHRIHCGTAATNVGMQKLALALGMHEEGRRFQALYLEGGYVDAVEYGVLRGEFESNAPHPDRQP